MITPPFNLFATRCPACNKEIRGIEENNPYKTLFNGRAYECIHCKSKLKWKRGTSLFVVRYGIVLGALTGISGAVYQFIQSGVPNYTLVAIFGLTAVFIVTALFSVPLLRLEK
ncbi:MAG: hypothetical protein MI756_00920 [Chromatiales bacterium]|nr:hypothetical protein [Chromatiales bacterium]